MCLKQTACLLLAAKFFIVNQISVQSIHGRGGMFMEVLTPPPQAVQKKLRGWNFPKNMDSRNFPHKVGLFNIFSIFEKIMKKTVFDQKNRVLTVKTGFSRHKF